MTNQKGEWRQIFSEKTNILALIVAIAANVYVFNPIDKALLAYLVRYIPEAIGTLSLLIPRILLTLLVYYVVAGLTRRFFVER